LPEAEVIPQRGDNLERNVGLWVLMGKRLYQ